MLAVLLGAALVGYGARFALRFALEKYEARLTDRIRSDVESKMLSPPERPPRATPRRDYNEDTVRNLPLPLAPTAPSTWNSPMRPPGFDSYSRATRPGGHYVYTCAPPATPHSSRSRRSPLVSPYTPPSRRSAKSFTRCFIRRERPAANDFAGHGASACETPVENACFFFRRERVRGDDLETRC